MERNFIYTLESTTDTRTQTLKTLERLALEQNINSIYKTCDSIEGLEQSLGALLYDDDQFKSYEIIYLVMQGQGNTICLDDYHYSLNEIAELFEGRMKGKIIHFANEKVLDLSAHEAQYFLDVSGAKAVSGYGADFKKLSSSDLDRAFFSLFEDSDDVIQIVEELHQKYYAMCKLLDFRLYY